MNKEAVEHLLNTAEALVLAAQTVFPDDDEEVIRENCNNAIQTAQRKLSTEAANA